MKTILITLSFALLGLGVSAQGKEERGERYEGYRHAIRSRVVVVPSIGFGYGYPYYSYPFLGYPYYGNPYFGYPYPPYYYRNSRAYYSLQMHIQSIRMDYKNRIQGVRHDKGLSHSRKRSEIRTLKSERDREIAKTQRDFYNRRSQGYFYKNQGSASPPNNNTPEHPAPNK